MFSNPMKFIKTVITLVNGNKARNMESENYISLTTVPTPESLNMIKQKAKGDFIILMGICMLDNGKLIKHMALANIFLETLFMSS